MPHNVIGVLIRKSLASGLMDDQTYEEAGEHVGEHVGRYYRFKNTPLFPKQVKQGGMFVKKLVKK